MTRPLHGIRVLDLSRVLAGPYCTMMLGDLGAEVIKIEQPGVGDETRRWGPPFAGGESAYYLAVNRNKKSVTLDLKQARGREIARALARVSDVLIENFKVGTLDALGLGYETLRADHPGLIWCSISGYGQDGPYADRAGYDFVAQGEGGIMSITGEPEGEPMKVGVAIVDITAGLFAHSGIMAALYARERTGRGQRVDVSLLSSALAWLANVGSNYLVSGETPRRYGNAHPNIVPYGVLRARDRWITVAVGTDRQFRALCRVLGLDDLGHDERFATNAARVGHRDALIPLLQTQLGRRDADEWLERMSAAGVPCGPINTIDRALCHPQAVHDGLVRDVPHPTAGSVKLVGMPYALSGMPETVMGYPPLLGEHTEEVLGDVLALPAEEVQTLRQAGVV